MGTTAQKLEYLGTTKSQLKDMINYGLPTENQITNETTFRNYVSSIFEAFIESLRDSTTLYTNLPKISGNGTQITLNDTANAPMRITLNPSALSQDATPTPTAPQQVHTISGNNSVVVCGKNLIGLGTSLNGYVDASTMKMQTVSTSIGYYFKTSQLPNTLTISDTGGNRMNVCYFNDIPANNVVATSRSASNDNPRTITVDKTYPYIHIQFSYREENVTNIQLEEGNQATTYSPYTSNTQTISLGNIEYCKIGDYEDKFILTSGKNLFDISQFPFTANKSYGNDGTWSSWNGYYAIADYFPVEGNTTYTFSNDLNKGIYYGLVEYDSSKTKINYTTATTRTFTTNANTRYIRFAIQSSTAPTWVQIEKNNQATSYEPYGTNQWYLKKNIGKVVLDGSESGWAYNSTYNLMLNSDYTWTNVPISPINCLTEQYSSHFVGISNTWTTFRDSANEGMFKLQSSSYRFALRINGVTSTASGQTWLSTNKPSFYYPLATPTYTQITGTLETQLENIYKNMLSYKGTTNVSQINNDLPFVLGVSAIKDLE